MFQGFFLADKHLVLIGGGPGLMHASDDLGETWQRFEVMTVNEGASIRAAAYGNGQYLAVDSHTKFYASEDGNSWEPLDIRVSGFVNRIEYAEGFFYILTRAGVYVALEGWEANIHRLPTDVIPSVLIERPQQLILAGEQGQILSSPVPSAVGYEAWAAQHFSASTPVAMRVPDADADGDGERNVEEYAYGNLPENVASHGVREIMQFRHSRGKLSGVDYGFYRNVPWFQVGVRYLVEYSLDLETWYPVDLGTAGFGYDVDEKTRSADRVWLSGMDRVEPSLKEGRGYFRHRVELRD